MSTAHTHEELDTWQLAEELKDKVFQFTARPNVQRHRDFCDDIQRSARSAPANISEGFYRMRPREHAYFLRIALASLGETKNHLGHARKQKYIDNIEFKELWRLASRAMGAAKSLHQYLMTCPPDGPVKLNLKPHTKNSKRAPEPPSPPNVEPNPEPLNREPEP